MTTLYGLSARGQSLNGWVFKSLSKDLFYTKELAEAHKAKFIEKCCDTSHFECAERESLEITFVEFELQDGIS